MSVSKIAIVGSNGFIGRHLTETLAKKEDINLRLYGRSAQSVFGETILYRQLDLLNKKQIEEYFDKTELIYYLVSETIPASSWQNPQYEIEKNLIPFLNFMETVSNLSVRKVVFISSAGTVYGSSEEKVKENSVTKPFSPYGIIKLTMENFLRYFEKKSNISYDIYRVSNVYGDGQNTSKGLGIINTFLEKIISENKITIFGNGESVRNYIYVKDVAELLTHSLSSSTQHSNIYNLSSNDTLSINKLISLMKEIVSENFRVEYKEIRQSDNPAIDLDNSKLLMACKDFYLTPIHEGISKTYNYLKNKPLTV